MGHVTLAAGITRRTFEVTDGAVRAVGVGDAGFRLVVDGAAIEASDLSLAGEPRLTEGDRRLSWRLSGRGLTVEVVVEAEPDAPVVRTRLGVSGQGRLQEVDVERWGPGAVERPGAVGVEEQPIGQPLWGDGVFAGLEHPGAENLVGPDGSARMGLPVDVKLGPTPWYAPSVVVGAARPGHERTAFWDELDRLRPNPPRLVVLVNNWYQLGAVGRMDESTVSAELEGFAEVANRHGLALDWYCLDDPWDGEWVRESGIWGRLAPQRFPGGLARLAAAADGRIGGIGLWVSPWGGYYERHDARVAWGGRQGYEVQDGQWPRLCPAGDRYHRHLSQALRAWTAAGVGYWKLDGVQFDCPEPDHGHPVGPGGRTAQMDRFAVLLDGVRAVDPSVVLAFTTGSNPSPWWLRHADFLWRGGLDDDAPGEYEGGRHERFATYIDSCLDSLRRTALSVSAVVTFSVVENQVRAYRTERAGEDWERHCWFLAGRGTHHHDLYVAPDSLSGREWDALARALRWARANQAVLARSRMIGGRPDAGEPYGFLSSAGGEVIVCLRNPTGRPTGLSLDPAELGGGVEDLTPVWGRAALPRRVAGSERVTVELEPFEVVLVSGRRQPG
jgi:hypothetical protein